MAKDWYKPFLNSKRWQKCRASYIAYRISIDGGMCEECRENQGYIVHHKIALDAVKVMNPDIALNFENLKYVCKDCHDKYEGHGLNGHGKIKPLCVFDEQGQPISLRAIDRREKQTPP